MKATMDVVPTSILTFSDLYCVILYVLVSPSCALYLYLLWWSTVYAVPLTTFLWWAEEAQMILVFSLLCFVPCLSPVLCYAIMIITLRNVFMLRTFFQTSSFSRDLYFSLVLWFSSCDHNFSLLSQSQILFPTMIFISFSSSDLSV